ncbi:MAG TPA: polymer-forming cytoskeletal protein [Thermoanaerobaculia bacterium]
MAFFGKPDTPAPSPSHSPSPSPAPPERVSVPSPVASTATSSSAATVIGSRVKIVGDLSGDEDVLVNGRLEGKIRVDRKVVVSPGAEVEGDVQAKWVIIGGRVHGQVMASERAELLPSGRVQGNVHSPRIVMAEGAQIQGRVVMPNDAATRPLSPQKAEEVAKRPIVPTRPEVAPPKPEETARRPSPPGTGG